MTDMAPPNRPQSHDAASGHDEEPPMREIAPGVHITGRARRILRSGDPRGDDYRVATARIQNVRSRLVHIRGELEDLARIESVTHDGICDDVAGSLTLALIALHELLEGPRGFAARAERTDELWATATADPDGHVIEDGASWEWRPLGIFKAGGPE